MPICGIDKNSSSARIEFHVEIQPVQLFVCKSLHSQKNTHNSNETEGLGGTFNKLFKNLAGSVTMEYWFWRR